MEFQFGQETKLRNQSQHSTHFLLLIFTNYLYLSKLHFQSDHPSNILMCSHLNTAEIFLENKKSNCWHTLSVVVASFAQSTIPLRLIPFLNDESKTNSCSFSIIFKFWQPSIRYAIKDISFILKIELINFFNTTFRKFACLNHFWWFVCFY